MAIDNGVFGWTFEFHRPVNLNKSIQATQFLIKINSGKVFEHTHTHTHTHNFFVTIYFNTCKKGISFSAGLEGFKG